MAEPQKKLEATIRSNENGRYLFLLNHGEEMLSVILEYSGKELLSGNTYQAGEKVKLPARCFYFEAAGIRKEQKI